VDHTRQSRRHPCVPGALARLSSRSLEPARARRGRRSSEAGAEPVVGGALRHSPSSTRFTTRSRGPNDQMGNALLPRSGTYAATHDQTTFIVRNSRLGLRVGAPDLGALGASAGRGDGLLRQPARGERGRLLQQSHHPDPPLLLQARDPGGRPSPFGQTWELLGWQAYFVPASVNLQGLRVRSTAGRRRSGSRRRSSSRPTWDSSWRWPALRPPQRAGGLPDGQAGVKLNLPWATGVPHARRREQRASTRWRSASRERCGGSPSRPSTRRADRRHHHRLGTVGRPPAADHRRLHRSPTTTR
jgi:hypothetical protein